MLQKSVSILVNAIKQIMKNILFDLKTENSFAFGRLYEENFNKVSKFVQNNNGNQAEAEDLFQDAMVVLVEKLRQDNFQLTASINTYVYAICKNLWYKKLRNRKLQFSIEDFQNIDFQNKITEVIENEMSYLEKLKGYLMNITDHCIKLIHDVFFKGKAIDEIQTEYGYSTKHNAQNQKYKCVEQIRKIKEQESISKKN